MDCGREAAAGRDVPAEHRLIAEDDGTLAQPIDKMAPSRLALIHTEAPEHLAGRGHRRRFGASRSTGPRPSI